MQQRSIGSPSSERIQTANPLKRLPSESDGESSRSGTPVRQGRVDLKRVPSFKLSRQPSNKALLMSQAGMSPSPTKRISTPVSDTMNNPGTGSILHDYVGEVLETTNTSVLGRQKTQAAIDYTE